MKKTGKIRFIHHSVLQHILSAATGPSTAAFHFSIEEAHNFIGTVCVTYLHLPIFQSQILTANRIRGFEVADKAKLGAKEAHPMISRLAEHLKSSKSTSSPYELDLELLALQAQAPNHNDAIDVQCFINMRYAIGFFTPNHSRKWNQQHSAGRCGCE